MSIDVKDGAQRFLAAFSDPQAVARYTDGPRRFVPGLEALHRMTGILLAERAPDDARILVLGAGGGMELHALAEMHPGWTFVGVDPAAEMLKLAHRVMGEHAHRAELIEGYVEDAPLGPFDGAVCLLTLHFLDARDRERTIGEIHRRLKPGAAFVAAHGSYPRDDAATRARWLSRYAAYAVSSGVDPTQAEGARAAVEAAVNMLDPAQDLMAMQAGGFTDAELFYTAFTWRGWVGHA